jgi:hypothetical protein
MSRQKITKLRAEIAEKQLQLGEIETAGAPGEHTRQLLAEKLEDLAGEYRKVIGDLARGCLNARTDIDFSVRRACGMTIGRPDEFIVGALVAHLGDKIVGDIESEMGRIAADYPALLSDNEQAAGLAKVKGELRALERQEEALLEAEELAGNQIERRPDADPVAVLGLPDDFCQEHGV